MNDKPIDLRCYLPYDSVIINKARKELYAAKFRFMKPKAFCLNPYFAVGQTVFDKIEDRACELLGVAMAWDINLPQKPHFDIMLFAVDMEGKFNIITAIDHGGLLYDYILYDCYMKYEYVSGVVRARFRYAYKHDEYWNDNNTLIASDRVVMP